MSMSFKKPAHLYADLPHAEMPYNRPIRSSLDNFIPIDRTCSVRCNFRQFPFSCDSVGCWDNQMPQGGRLGLIKDVLT